MATLASVRPSAMATPEVVQHHHVAGCQCRRRHDCIPGGIAQDLDLLCRKLRAIAPLGMQGRPSQRAIVARVAGVVVVYDRLHECLPALSNNSTDRSPPRVDHCAVILLLQRCAQSRSTPSRCLPVICAKSHLPHACLIREVWCQQRVAVPSMVPDAHLSQAVEEGDWQGGRKERLVRDEHGAALFCRPEARKGQEARQLGIVGFLVVLRHRQVRRETGGHIVNPVLELAPVHRAPAVEAECEVEASQRPGGHGSSAEGFGGARLATKQHCSSLE
mmetsp:Transcript_129751/g.361466  ORF Transcript_129751/g.361466 Transcript_129751/m.361466 type:complete len:275 (-) Transcript_129751:156-980(-)